MGSKYGLNIWCFSVFNSIPKYVKSFNLKTEKETLKGF